MYYEVDVNGNYVRALPGYFKGFKKDLSGADLSVLSETQKDYLSIPDDNIIEMTDEEHELLLYKANAYEIISIRSREERAAILDDMTISNIAIGATGGYPAYLTSANVAAMIDQFKAISKNAKVSVSNAGKKEDVDAVLKSLSFPTEEQILTQLSV